MLAEMLEAAKEPIGKTALMNKVGFTAANMKHYTAAAHRSGFIEYDSTSRKFRTTVKGRKYLEVYNRLIQLVEKNATLERSVNDLSPNL